jgi:hypothetical protein
MTLSILALPANIGQLILKWATAKYIEAAGSTPAEWLARAQHVKSLASEIDQTVLGTLTVAQLQALTTADLSSKNMKPSEQILVTGLVGLIANVLPAANTGLLSAALGADVNLVLVDIETVATSFGA